MYKIENVDFWNSWGSGRELINEMPFNPTCGCEWGSNCFFSKELLQDGNEERSKILCKFFYITQTTCLWESQNLLTISGR